MRIRVLLRGQTHNGTLTVLQSSPAVFVSRRPSLLLPCAVARSAKVAMMQQDATCTLLSPRGCIVKTVGSAAMSIQCYSMLHKLRFIPPYALRPDFAGKYML